MQNSTELLRQYLGDWASLYGHPLTEGEIRVWVRIFQAAKSSLLAEALESVTKHSKRMPTPGNVTEALRIASNAAGQQSDAAKRFYADTETTELLEGRTVPCWIGADGVRRYRPTDICEGREVLAKLKELCLKPSGTVAPASGGSLGGEGAAVGPESAYKASDDDVPF